MKYLTIIILGIIFIAIILGVSGWITMIAWNFVIPFLFHLPKITIWHGVAINVLLSTVRGATVYANKK